MNLTKSVVLFGLALTASPFLTLAEEAAPVAAAPAPAASAKAVPAARPKMTEAQRAEMRARREKFMAERRAKMEAKMLEVVKKYVSDETQAKALVKELQETVIPTRRPPAPRRRPQSKQPDVPAEPAK